MSRMEIDQARLLTQYAAWKMDSVGKQNARQELSMVKVVVPNMMMTVLDRAIQCLGALGVSDDTPIAAMWRNGRALRIADGPDEVHKSVIARRGVWAARSRAAKRRDGATHSDGWRDAPIGRGHRPRRRG